MWCWYFRFSVLDQLCCGHSQFHIERDEPFWLDQVSHIDFFTEVRLINLFVQLYPNNHSHHSIISLFSFNFLVNHACLSITSLPLTSSTGKHSTKHHVNFSTSCPPIRLLCGVTKFPDPPRIGISGPKISVESRHNRRECRVYAVCRQQRCQIQQVLKWYQLSMSYTPLYKPVGLIKWVE